MRNFLLGIITINLTIISVYLTIRSIEPAQAEIDGMGAYELKYDYDFKKGVMMVVEDNCNVKGSRISC